MFLERCLYSGARAWVCGRAGVQQRKRPRQHAAVRAQTRLLLELSGARSVGLYSGKAIGVKTPGFSPGCRFPFAWLWLLGVSLSPGWKRPILLHTHTSVWLFSFSPLTPSAKQSEWNREISSWVPAEATGMGRCPRPRTLACRCWQPAAQPTGNKKTADSINTSVRCSKKKRWPPLLEWEAT